MNIHVTLLKAIPTPHITCMPTTLISTRHTLWGFEWDWDLSRLINDYESQRLSFQVSKLELRCKRKEKKRKTYLSLSIHIGSHKCLKNKPRIMSLIEHTIQTHGNTCPLVFVRNYKPCHIPLSCRHMISAWSRPAYLTIFVVILDWMAPSG